MALHVKFVCFASLDLFGGRFDLDRFDLYFLFRLRNEVRLLLVVRDLLSPFAKIVGILAPAYAFGFVHKILLGRADPLDSHRPVSLRRFRRIGKPFVALSPAYPVCPLLGQYDGVLNSHRYN